MTREFEALLREIPQIGQKAHSDALVRHATANLPHITETLKMLPAPVGAKARSAVVISAGPSVHRQNSIKRILDSGYQGSVIAVDGSYCSCLKAGLVPDYLVTLDPHPTRMVRWFGDPDFEKNSAGDDYFARQDLDVDFRENSIRQNKYYIELVNTHGHKTKAIVCSSAPANVVERIKTARFDAYWWNPLVDDPTQPDSLTRKLYGVNKLPCMNTGGNVGTAAWIFATEILKAPTVGLTGMDFGYYAETPLNQTQTYYELLDRVGTEEGIEKYFVDFTFPLSGKRFYTDSIYAWYRENFLELLEKSRATTYNCTEGGTLFSDELSCIDLDEFLRSERG